MFVKLTSAKTNNAVLVNLRKVFEILVDLDGSTLIVDHGNNWGAGLKVTETLDEITAMLPVEWKI